MIFFQGESMSKLRARMPLPIECSETQFRPLSGCWQCKAAEHDSWRVRSGLLTAMANAREEFVERGQGRFPDRSLVDPPL